MKHGIKPTSFMGLVKPDTVEEKTSGGLYLPEDAKQKDEWAQTRGELLAVGPMWFEFEDWPKDRTDEKPVPGDTVHFGRYSTSSVQGNDGDEYWLVKDRDILSTIGNEK